MGYQNACKIKDLVLKNDKSDDSIGFIKSCLNDSSRMPMVDIPTSKIAEAALDKLGVKKYTGTDKDIIYFKEVFNNLK